MSQLSISVADDDAKLAIFRLRHEVYAVELQQYESTSDRTLPDAQEVHSDYLALWAERELIGFVGITPPTSPRFSVDKHMQREQQSFQFDHNLYEIRALTVSREWRSFRIAGCLMYGAFRWVAAHSGSRIVAMGRQDVIDLYLRFGFQRVGPSYACGAITYDLLIARVFDMEENVKRYRTQLDRMKRNVRWDLDITFPSSVLTTEL